MKDKVLELLGKLKQEKQQKTAELIQAKAPEIEAAAMEAYNKVKEEQEEVCKKSVDSEYQTAERYLNSLLDEPEEEAEGSVEEQVEEEIVEPEVQAPTAPSTGIFGGVL